jgi:6-phosphofructokinase
MQVFGAGSGYVALYAAYSSGEVDYVILPELVECEGIRAILGPDAERCIDLARFVGIRQSLAEVAGPTATLLSIYDAGLRKVIGQAKHRVVDRVIKKRHALVVVAEGALGPYEHGERTKLVISFKDLVGVLKTGLEDASGCGKGPKWLKDVKVTSMEPTYLIRDNAPRSYDIALCKFIGKAMVDAALAGYTDCMVARWCGQYGLIPLSLATALTSRVDPHDYFFRTMAEKYRRR